MDEFLNRITAQRKVINIVNGKTKNSFPLVGLSSKSIQRWKLENSISNDSELMKALISISSQLFFLANRSQEQVTNEYRLLSKSISDLIDNLDQNINKWL